MDFWTWHSFAGGDYGRVTISSDGGCTWTEIGPHITGSGGGVWSLASVNLSAYAGQTVLIGFAFSADCCNGESAGWYIDGVFIW
jgi:bacillopeptidase F